MVFYEGAYMNAAEYKKYHESYMANNEGTTALHVFFCIFFTVQCSIYIAFRSRRANIQSIYEEYIFIVLPLILVHTVFANYIYFWNVIIFSLCFYELQYNYPRITVESITKSLTQMNVFRSKHIQSVSCLRGLTYLITVYAILAVDFKAFRKDLRKTEQYGFSLMDTGVGLFTLMSGLVHKDLKNNSLKQILKSNLKFFLVLVALGCARFWTVKALDYHENVTEYGVHWNFFFTVAVCKVTSTFLLYISNRPLLFSIATLFVHDFLLCNGVESWVFSNIPRTDLLAANREGICSCLGYTSLYLFSAYIKQVVSKIEERYKVLTKLVIASVYLCLLSAFMNTYRSTSRTLANSSYCIYLCAVFVTILTILYFLEVSHQDKKYYFETPILISAVNQNGLLYFLIANLLTGAINLSVQTLFVSDLFAILILNCYMVITLSFMVWLTGKGIKI